MKQVKIKLENRDFPTLHTLGWPTFWIHTQENKHIYDLLLVTHRDLSEKKQVKIKFLKIIFFLNIMVRGDPSYKKHRKFENGRLTPI